MEEPRHATSRIVTQPTSRHVTSRGDGRSDSGTPIFNSSLLSHAYICIQLYTYDAPSLPAPRFVTSSRLKIFCQFCLRFLWFLTGVSGHSSLARYHNSEVILVLWLFHAGVMLLSCQFRVGSMLVSCQFYVVFLPVSCRFRAITVPVPCRFRVGSEPVPCQPVTARSPVSPARPPVPAPVTAPAAVYRCVALCGPVARASCVWAN